jgi:rRNA maturation endonuclease Nob1
MEERKKIFNYFCYDCALDWRSEYRESCPECGSNDIIKIKESITNVKNKTLEETKI